MLASFNKSELSKTAKCFHFTDDTDIIELSCSSSDSLCSETEHHICGESCLNVKISEILNPNFGMYVWPCAPVLGKYIWTKRMELNRRTVLELGAGTGLCSVIAARCGAHVVITDSKRYYYVIELGKYNMQLNNVSSSAFEMMELTWGSFSPCIIDVGHIDIILGSDVFYDPNDFEDILVTVSYILKRNANAEFWCAYEHRCSDWNINYLLEKWDLKCEEVPLDSFGADKFNVAGCDLPGLKKISLFIISYSLSQI